MSCISRFSSSTSTGEVFDFEIILFYEHRAMRDCENDIGLERLLNVLEDSRINTKFSPAL